MVLLYDFEESIGYWLTLTTQAFHRAGRGGVAPHGITYRQSIVLAWLALEGELSQAELATKMMVEPPTLVGILDRIEHGAGWITRNCCLRPAEETNSQLTTAEPVWEKIAEDRPVNHASGEYHRQRTRNAQATAVSGESKSQPHTAPDERAIETIT